jgi:acylphosphatase
MKRIHLIISGLVQGVGYRTWVIEQANRLGISGWVKNLSDGSVEVSAESGENALKQFITICRKGPLAARVDRTDVQWEQITGGYDGFEVIY